MKRATLLLLIAGSVGLVGCNSTGAGSGAGALLPPGEPLSNGSPFTTTQQTDFSPGDLVPVSFTQPDPIDLCASPSIWKHIAFMGDDPAREATPWSVSGDAIHVSSAASRPCWITRFNPPITSAGMWLTGRVQVATYPTGGDPGAGDRARDDAAVRINVGFGSAGLGLPQRVIAYAFYDGPGREAFALIKGTMGVPTAVVLLGRASMLNRNLVADFQTAFPGMAVPAVSGMGVASDSNDTRSSTSATISGLTLGPREATTSI